MVDPSKNQGKTLNRRGRPGRLPISESTRITKRITAISLLIGVFLIALKTVVFYHTDSVGILSSLVHSILDITAGLSSFFAVRYAARPPDKDYRYGHGKAEGFSAIFQVCVIVLASAHLLEAAIRKVSHPHILENSGYAVLAMVIAIIVTAWLLVAQTWAIRATGSLAVRGDRAHYFADLSANFAVILGVLLSTYTPFVRADAIVGVVIALWLLSTAYRLARLAWYQLMDRELPDDERQLILALASDDPHVNGVHDLRSRTAGPNVHIQMQLDLSDAISLNEAHEIVIAAERRILAAYPSADILIHPHPKTCVQLHGNAIFRQNLVD